MEGLKENWLTEGLIDFEYKKYILLAYLKKVKDSFRRIELYPFMADLVFHYRNLVALKESKALIYDSFPKELSPESLTKLEITYRKIIEDDAIMRELESIIEFAMPEFRSHLDEGAQIYEHVESHCEITAVGLTPLYANEGYLFISQPPQNEANVYRYQVTFFEKSQESMRSVHTRFLKTEPRTLANSFENIKMQLIREHTDLPNPSVYLILSKISVPFAQTLVPVAKRLLMKRISKAA